MPKTSFTKADIRRLYLGVSELGLPVGAFELTKYGTLRLVVDNSEKSATIEEEKGPIQWSD